MLAFIHIPKTAGTTLHKILFHQYKRIFVRHDTDGTPDERLASVIRQNKTQVIIGHFSADMHTLIPSIRYITCLREPVARIKSHYHHALNDPAHYLHHAIKSEKMDLATYVSSGLSGELNNGMTRMIAGVHDFHNSVIDESVLDQAKNHIETLFDGVILSEHFDPGILMLAQTLHWKTPYYLRRKVGRYRHTDSSDNNLTCELIRENNRFDCELYAWAKNRFEHQKSQNPNLDPMTRDFQSANQIKGKVIFCFRELKQRLHLS